MPIIEKIVRSLKSLPLLTELVRANRNLRNHQNIKVTNLIRRKKENTDLNVEGRNILLATGGGGNSVAVKVESAIGIGLMARNHNVSALLCDESLPACFQSTLDFDRNERAFSNHGPSRLNCSTCFKPAEKVYKSLAIEVHRLSKYITADELSTARLLAKSIETEEIQRYSIDGVSIGEHAYAGTLRFYARGVLGDPHAEKVLRRYFLAALITKHAVERIITTNNIHCVVLHHGLYVPQGIITETARRLGCKVSIWHVAYRKQTFMFSHDETYHHSLMTEPVTLWENIELDDSRQAKIENYLKSRWYGSADWVTFNPNSQTLVSQSLKEMGVDMQKPIILALTNVVWDAQLHYPTNVFESMTEWLEATVDYFSANTGMQLVIRVHPAELSGTIPSRQFVRDELLRRFGHLPQNVFIVDADNNLSSYALAELADTAIIYGTKMGVELSAKGMNVIVAGEAWVRGKGVTRDAISKTDYFSALDELPIGSPMPRDMQHRALKYAYHFFFRRMIPFKFIKHISGSKLFEIDDRDESVFMPGGDRGLDLVCNGVLGDGSFVYLDENDD